MEDAIPGKAWRPFSIDGRRTLPTRSTSITISYMSSNNMIFVGIFVRGTSAKRVRVRAYKRVRNGKTQLVKAHWRYIMR